MTARKEMTWLCGTYQRLKRAHWLNCNSASELQMSPFAGWRICKLALSALTRTVLVHPGDVARSPLAYVCHLTLKAVLTCKGVAPRRW